jgi:hypothetical protein
VPPSDLAAGPAEHFDVLALEDFREHVAGLWLLEREDAVRRLHDGHPHAEAGECLGQLGADGAAAHDQKRRGQLLGLDRLAIGPVLDPVETRDRGYRGRGPRADHDGACGLQDCVIDLHLAGPGQPAAAAEEVSALALEALDRRPVVPVVGDLAQALGHRCPVRSHCGAARHQGDAAALGESVGGPDDRLAGNAAPVGAFATDQVLFHPGDGQAGVGQLFGDLLAAGPHPDHDDVEFLVHAAAPALFSARVGPGARKGSDP